MKKVRYHAMSQEDLFEKFKTGLEGISSQEAKKRLARDGKNELPKKKKDEFDDEEEN